MFNIITSLDYAENKYRTKSYILNKKNYLPTQFININKTSDIQRFVIYNKMLDLLFLIKYINDEALFAIDEEITRQLLIMSELYPQIKNEYAKYCSTIKQLITGNSASFIDEDIQNIYDAIRNKTTFTRYGQQIITIGEGQILPRLSEYNTLLTKTELVLSPITIVNNFVNDNIGVVVDAHTQHIEALLQ